MQPDKPNLPPGWRLSPRGYYHWISPEEADSPDVYIERLGEEWEVEYWVKNTEDWTQVCVPPSPEPPFELAEALYYAAQ